MSSITNLNFPVKDTVLRSLGDLELDILRAYVDRLTDPNPQLSEYHTLIRADEKNINHNIHSRESLEKAINDGKLIFLVPRGQNKSSPLRVRFEGRTQLVRPSDIPFNVLSKEVTIEPACTFTFSPDEDV